MFVGSHAHGSPPKPRDDLAAHHRALQHRGNLSRGDVSVPDALSLPRVLDLRRQTLLGDEEEEISGVLVPAGVAAPPHRDGVVRDVEALQLVAYGFDERGAADAAPRVALHVRAHEEVRAVRESLAGVIAGYDRAPDKVGHHGRVVDGVGAEPVPAHLRKHDHVASLVPRRSPRARLGEVQLHLAHRGGSRLELVNAALVLPRGGLDGVVERLRGVALGVELLAGPRVRIAVHEERVTIEVFHGPDEALGPNLFAVVAHVLVRLGILVHRGRDGEPGFGRVETRSATSVTTCACDDELRVHSMHKQLAHEAGGSGGVPPRQ